MTNEEFQALVLQKLEKLDVVAEKVDKIETSMASLDARMGKLEMRMDGLELRMSNLEMRMDGLETRMSSLETRVDGIETQLKETNGFVQALIHRTDELDAKFDGLLTKTATVAAVEEIKIVSARMEKKIDILSHRVAAQDGEIELLKLVK